MLLAGLLGWFLGRKRGRVKMRTYQVWMKGNGKMIEVKAGNFDLCIDSDKPDTAYWNFSDNGEDGINLHAFPFADVGYIVSVE